MRTLRLRSAFSNDADVSLLRPPDAGVSFSPDGAYVLSGSQDGTLKLWDPERGAELRTMAGHTGAVRACAWRPRTGHS